MPDTDPIRITTEVDLAGLSGFTAGAQKAGAAAAEMAQKFMQSGLSAKEAAAALVNLGYAEKEAAAAAGVLVEMQAKVATQGTQAMSALGRATAMAGARVAGELVPGIGMAGYQIGRVASFLPGLGQLFVLAFPVALIAMAVEQLDNFNRETAKTTQQLNEAAIASGDWSGKIEVENLKLEDQIRKFENRPARNLLKEAIVEAEQAADDLAKSINDVTQKMLDEMTSSSLGASAVNFFNHIFNPDAAGAVGEAAAKKALQPFEDQQQQLRLTIAQVPETDTKAKAELQKLLADNYRAAAEAAKQQEDVLEQNRAKEVSTPHMYDATISALKAYRLAMLDAATAAAEMEKHGKLAVHVAGQTQAQENIELFIESNRRLKSMDDETFSALVRNIDEAKSATDELAKKGATDYDEMTRAMREASDAQKAGTQQQIEAVKTQIAQFEAHQAALQSNAEATKVRSPWGSLSAAPQQAEAAAMAAEIEKLKAAMNELSLAKSKLADLPFKTPEQQEQITSLQNEQNDLLRQIAKLQEGYQKLNTQIANASPWNQLRNGMEQSFNAGFNAFNQGFIKMLADGKSFTASLQALWNGMASTFIDFVLKMGEKWVEEHVLMALASKLADELGLASHTATVAEQIATNKALAMSSAGLAGANATASFALAPWPIDMGAAAFGASMMASAAGFAAFEEGGIVPGSVGNAVPIMAHAQEMVLPANVSNWVMRAAGADGSGSSTHNFHFHSNVNAIDGKNAQEFLEKHADTLGRIAMKHIRRRSMR